MYVICFQICDKQSSLFCGAEMESTQSKPTVAWFVIFDSSMNQHLLGADARGVEADVKLVKIVKVLSL